VAHADPPNRVSRALPAPADTDRLGQSLAHACALHATAISERGLQVNLSGDLGTGKTSLIRAWLRGLGVGGPVRSPSFAVLETYRVALPASSDRTNDRLEAESLSSLDFYHFDFYRFADPAEFLGAGFRDHFGAGRICAIEWPEKAGERLPTADVSIALAVEGAGRRATLSAGSELGHACLDSALRTFDLSDAD